MLVWRGPHLLWLCLQTFGLVLQARPFPFHSTDCFQYSYLICDWCCHRNGKGLACETNLSKVNQKKSQVDKTSALKTMFEMVQKTPKQQSTQRKMSPQVFREDKTRTAFHLFLCKLFEDSCHGCKLIYEVQVLQTIATGTSPLEYCSFVSMKRPSFL